MAGLTSVFSGALAIPALALAIGIVALGATGLLLPIAIGIGALIGAGMLLTIASGNSPTAFIPGLR